MISSDLRAQFLGYELATIVHPIVHAQFSREQILENLTAEIDEDMRKGLDPAFAQGFHNLCPVEGAAPTDYMIRRIELEPGFEILAGIRFRGLDLDRPFVAILHRNRSFENVEHLRKLMPKLRDAFRVFGPKAVLFYQSSLDSTLTLPGEDVDKRILMGAIADIADIPVISGLAIVKARELDFYDRYKDEYAIVTMLTPDYLRAETAEREEDMQRYVREDATYKVLMNGEFAGVFIVTPHTMFGTHGYYVIENLLFEKFRGKKLADSVQSLVAQELLRLGGKVLYGSIYPTNLPSYNAALRSKRIDIGGNYMVPMNR